MPEPPPHLLSFCLSSQVESWFTKIVSSPGHSQMLRDKIWEWPGDEAITEIYLTLSTEGYHRNYLTLSTERYAWELTSLVPWLFSSFCHMLYKQGRSLETRLERGYTVKYPMPVDVIPHNRMGLLRNAWYSWCTPIYSCSSSGNISLISKHGISKTVVYLNWSYEHSLPAYSKFEPITVPG